VGDCVHQPPPIESETPVRISLSRSVTLSIVAAARLLAAIPARGTTTSRPPSFGDRGIHTRNIDIRAEAGSPRQGQVGLPVEQLQSHGPQGTYILTKRGKTLYLVNPRKTLPSGHPGRGNAGVPAPS